MSSRNLAEFAAARVRALEPSPTLQVSEKIRSLKAQGVEIIDLAAGDPEVSTPEHIRRAAAEALAAGDTHYVATAGIPELRHAIARKLATENGIQIDPDREVLLTPGGKAALFTAMQALIEPGAEVLILDPSWVSFAPMVQLAGGTPVRIALPPDDHFRITHAQLAAAVTPRTCALLVNSPNNPTGRVLDAGELEAIRALAVEHDLLVFSDEIYERMVFDGRRHLSPGAFPGLERRTLTFNGFSKSYAMTGWRLGYVAGPAPLIAALQKVHGHSITCVPGFIQRAALAALTGPMTELDALVARYEQRRRGGAAALASVAGVHCPLPEGAFYLFADVRRLGRSSVQIAEALVETAHVAVMPGGAFGAAGEGFLRIALTAPDEVFSEALRRVASALGAL